MKEPSSLSCAGCGTSARPIEEIPYPFRCPHWRQGDDIDHVMTHVLDVGRVAFPDGDQSNPFVRYRQLFHSYHVAQGHGISDEAYVATVERLDSAIAQGDGHGFEVTPFARSAELSDQLGFGAEGGVFIKDETGNVSGSHKARHLMGIMLYLQVVEHLRPQLVTPRPLAIASCGNAALAAAVVAQAAGYPLHVFIPASADPAVVAALERRGVSPTRCGRHTGVPGDPSYARFHDALAQGALPFCCQGNENGLTIEGGETLGYEIVSTLGAEPPDRLLVQVGGGALASACIQALLNARRLGRLSRLPRIHAVQTHGAFPLKRAYDRLVERILRRLSLTGLPRPGATPTQDEYARAEFVMAHATAPILQEELHFARSHRSLFMWPWEQPPRSIAHGILDDETYDWAVVVEGMLMTGGYPIIVSESTLAEANALARTATRIDVCHTGSAGLAGLLHLLASSRKPAPGERIVVIFSGIERCLPSVSHNCNGSS